MALMSAACWLSARETKERREEDNQLMKETNQALAEAGLKYEPSRRCVTGWKC